MMLFKCCTQYVSKFGKLGSGHRTGNDVFIPMPVKGNAQNVQTTIKLHLFHMPVGLCSEILQVRLQQYMKQEFPDVQIRFRKGRGTRDQIANIHWIIENAREFQKKSTSALLTMPKPSTVWITINCGKFFKRWEYQTT